MTSNGLRDEIERSLQRASERQLVRVMGFIDRLPSRTTVEDLVERVRPRLALVRPVRPMTLDRVLTLPFEDLLAENDQAEGSPWLVPRSLHRAVLAIAHRRIPEPLMQDLQAAVIGKTMDDDEALLDAGDTLWPAAAAALRSFLLHGAGEERVEGWGERHRNRLAGLALVLENGATSVPFLRRLPGKPMGTLNEAEQAQAVGMLHAMRAVSEDLFRYGYTMLMRRSSDPTDIFHLALNNDLDILHDRRERLLADAASECLDEINALHTNMAAHRQQSLNLAADRTSRLVALIQSLERAPPAVRVDRRQLRATKERASQTIVTILERSLSGELRQSMHDLTAAAMVADDDVMAAEDMARSAKKIEVAGSRLGIGRPLDAVLQRELAACHALLSHRAGQGAAGGNTVMDALRLVEIMFGPDAAEAILEQLNGAAGRG
ncbi:MAG TPA: hypothetical protein VD860_04460 [Azospirillum sp.]|nr:hypothetical protein [Azospirillum sp.]